MKYTMSDSDRVSPSEWTDVTTLYDNGVFTVITGFYEGGTSPGCCIRWNDNSVDSSSMNRSDMLGKHDWFLIPPSLVDSLLHTLLSESLKRPRFEQYQTAILRALRTLSRQVRPNTIQHAIALYGASNTGKTTTLNILIDLLLDEAAKSAKNGIVATDSGNYNMDTKAGDRCVAIRVFGKLVVVMTSGDIDAFVKKGIDFALRFNADIVVCATRKRTDSRAWSAFYEFVAKMGVSYEAIEKIWVQNPADAHVQAQKQAEDLFNRIRLA